MIALIVCTLMKADTVPITIKRLVSLLSCYRAYPAGGIASREYWDDFMEVLKNF
jgi:hypothetical protein